MNVTVVGAGYVGLVVGICLADMGNDVICVDINEEKVAKLKDGQLPIYEPGLKNLLQRNVRDKRLSFTTDLASAVAKSDIVFIAVWTPQSESGEADLSAVKAVAKSLADCINDYKVVVIKSTVPVGTAKMVEDTIKEHQKDDIPFDVVSNPEFLREGNAIRDFVHGDRIVIGHNTQRAKEYMEKLYRPFVRTFRPILFVDNKSAEIIKYASNCMLATRISFMNELAKVCENVGANVKSVAAGMGFDNRIGPKFLQAGVGYGGSCFPKDVNAFIAIGKEHGAPQTILEQVDKINEKQKRSLLPKIKKLVGENLAGKKIAIWGLSFKPKTDDMREAPSLIVIKQLQDEGAEIIAYDPVAIENAKALTQNITFTNTPLEALKDVSCMVLITEWDEFRSFSFSQARELMTEPNIVDGRNIYDPDDMKEAGFNYISVGR